MLSKLLLYYHTLRHLRWVQIAYHLVNKLKRFGKYLPAFKHVKNECTSVDLVLSNSIQTATSYLGENEFEFLNIKQKFTEKIDWNETRQGKLWVYNLNYFEFLSQANLNEKEGLSLIENFIKNEKIIKDGFEPFPLSLRGLFWIKFLSRYQIKDDAIDQSLYRQYTELSKYPEYHLMGNHLLENAFSLLFAAYYFNQNEWLKQANRILEEELEEQILEDGAHFELSPMYHQLILFRLLDAINLLQNNTRPQNKDLLFLLKQKASLMLGWMTQMTFANGEMPMLNDSAPNIAPVSDSLLRYAKRLNIKRTIKALGESGYRKVLMPTYELLIDAGNIGPDYIPGHAHSDTFNFILYHKNQPLIVDTGISTYEKNARRKLERSTFSHNTVMVNGEEQSKIWAGFRVAQRAKIILFDEKEDSLTAAHDGYRSVKTTHQRKFIYHENRIEINDFLTSDRPAHAFLHFHPDVHIQLLKNRIEGKFGSIQFTNAIKIKTEPYQYALGYNKTQLATKVVIQFKESLITSIQLS